MLNVKNYESVSNEEIRNKLGKTLVLRKKIES